MDCLLGAGRGLYLVVIYLKLCILFFYLFTWSLMILVSLYCLYFMVWNLQSNLNEQLLFEAAEDGNCDEIRRLVETGAHKNCIDRRV